MAPVCQAVELSAIALGRIFARDEIGRHGAERRAGEGAGDAEQGRDAEQDRQADESAPCRGKEDERADQFEEDHRPGDMPPVQPVGRPAADRCQDEQRHELDQADQAELKRGLADVHRRAGDVVDLPADDDDHCHLADRRRQPRQPEGPEIGDAERFGDQRHGPKVTNVSRLSAISRDLSDVMAGNSLTMGCARPVIAAA